LALVCLLKRSVVLTPPPEPGIAMVFAPAPSPEAARPPPAEPQAAEAQPEEPATPTLPQPEAKTEEPAPPIPEPETPVEQAAPLLPLPEAQTAAAVPPTHQPVPSQHPPPRRVAVARAPALDPRPAMTPSATPAAVAVAPLLPAHPVAGMESDRPPVYPETARRRGQQGRVLLQVNVSAEGLPVTVSVAQSSGYPSLDAAALTAVQRWRFVPATRAGAPVAASAEVPVRFRLLE
jgi:protein TonB